jgi:hypothetical protein
MRGNTPSHPDPAQCPWLVRPAALNPKAMKHLFVSLLSLAVVSLTTACAHAVDIRQVERELTTTGAVGWVHGSSQTQGLYAFTYRNPNDFFDFVVMSLVPDNDEILKQLAALDRHDKVKITGSFLHNPSPQKHIAVTKIEMVKKFVSPYPMPAYEHEAKLPEELLNKSSALFLVHALYEDGHLLVTEYKDSIVPIWVKNGALTQDLFRGDLIQLAFRVQQNPDQPTHLRILEDQPQAVQVKESIRAKHGKPGSIEGELVMFPKSPEIMFNVFAVLEKLPEGLTRQYTLVNFDDANAFTAIRKKLQDAWDRHGKSYVNGRNKLVSTKIRVKATGTFNDINANQANPQILLKSADDLVLTEQN